MLLNYYLYLFFIWISCVGPALAFFHSKTIVKSVIVVKRLNTRSLLLFSSKRGVKNDYIRSTSPQETKPPSLDELEQELKTPFSQPQESNERLLKLKVEASSPFRLLRQYLFFAMIGGGSLGTVVGIPQIVKVLSDNSFDETKTALFNLAVNVGGVVAGALLFIRERKQEEEKLEKYRKIEQRANNQLTQAEIERRERLINLLPVEILLGVNKTRINSNALQKNPTSNANDTSLLFQTQISSMIQPKVNTTEITRTVSINDLHEKGRQSVVIVTGDYSYIKDCLVDLRLRDQDEFKRENIFIIPFCNNLSDQSRLERDYEEAEKTQTSTKKGFQTQAIPTTTQTETNAASLKKVLEMLAAGYIGRPKQV